jgi:hypothetical protein
MPRFLSHWRFACVLSDQCGRDAGRRSVVDHVSGGLCIEQDAETGTGMSQV